MFTSARSGRLAGLFEMCQMAVERIHQEPPIAGGPIPQRRSALLHTGSQREPIRMALQCLSDFSIGQLHEAPALIEEFLCLIHWVWRPMRGVNPLHLQAFDELDAGQIGEDRE